MRMLKLSLSSMQKLVSQMKQDPQNADLKLQLRDLQAKITALSERQVRLNTNNQALLQPSETFDISLLLSSLNECYGSILF
uniref:Uncharacterized protein n=1 Tax=Sinocyclocheilus rhinocerous TaxID=307959 RepID=A0A673IBC7_9TELE